MSKKETYEPTAEEALEILRDVLRVLRESGVKYQRGNRPAKDEKPAAFVLVIPHASRNEDGSFSYAAQSE